MSRISGAKMKRFIAEAALARANELPALQRADLFETIAKTLLSGAAATEANLAAFTIRETERHQLTLAQILGSEK